MNKLMKLGAILVFAALQLSACSSNESANNTMNVDENLEDVSEVNNQTATRAGQALPEFRIPAPQASAQMVLPRALFAPGQPTLQQVAAALRERLGHAGYDQIGFYRVTNGFALATPMERIAPDGRRFDGTKGWAVDASGLASLSRPLTLAGMMDALLHADPGSYRVMVFVVTNRTVTNSAAPMKSDVARTLVSNGVADLPEGFAQAKFGPDYRVTVLIYEFSRTAVGKPAQFSRPSSRSAASQLRLAQILRP
jgi:hypothetical protein